MTMDLDELLRMERMKEKDEQIEAPGKKEVHVSIMHTHIHYNYSLL